VDIIEFDLDLKFYFKK